MKETSIIELREEQKNLRAQSKQLLEAAKAEKRMLSEAENETLAMNELRCKEINMEIEERRDLNASQAFRQATGESRQFSLVRAIRNQLEGRAQEASEADVLSRAAERQHGLETKGNLLVPFSTRAAMTTTSAVTNGLIDQDNQDVVLPLENNLVFAEAGARLMTGLRGDVAFPGLSDVTVAWDAETDDAADGTPSHSSALKLSPKRICAYVDISRQFLIQENQDVEMYIRDLIAIAVAQKIEATALGKAAAGDGPVGLFNTKPTCKGTFAWAKVVEMETAVSEAGGLQGNLAYILHSQLFGKAKSTAKDTSGAGGMVINDYSNLLNGYKVLSTGNVCSGLETAAASGSTPAVNDGYGAIFGNWSDFIIANWGNMDILVDNYTQGIGGKVRLILNSYWNYGVTRAGSFKTAALAL